MVTVGDFMPENFEINQGVKQGDPPSPFFNVLCLNLIQMEKDAPIINSIKLPCLFGADDLVLISATKEGLQLNPIAYGILRLSQLRGWDFYPTPQKTMLKLFD